MSVNMTKGKRVPGFELLRILSIFFIICLHYLRQTGYLPGTGTELTFTVIYAQTLEILCIVFLNCFILLSGYFAWGGRFRTGRFLELMLTVLFYSLLIPAALCLTGSSLKASGIWELWYYIMPVSMEHYWFVTSYILTFLFSPFLVAGMDRLSREDFRTLLILLLFFLCVLPTVSPVHLTSDNAGYNTVWFMTVYLIGGYLRRYSLRIVESVSSAGMFLLYLLFSGIGLLWFILFQIVNLRTGKLAWYAELPTHHNFLPVLLGAVCMFLCFAKMNIPEGKAADAIRFVSPLVFGVYLIHEHLEVRDIWLPTLCRFLGGVPEGPALVIHMLLCAACLFVCCAAVDAVRSIIFGRAKALLSRR